MSPRAKRCAIMNHPRRPHHLASRMPQVASGRLSMPPRIVHFGDTPNDVKAAVAAGAMPVGLATGAYTLAQLRDCAAGLGALDGALLLENLEDTAAVMAALR